MPSLFEKIFQKKVEDEPFKDQLEEAKKYCESFEKMSAIKLPAELRPHTQESCDKLPSAKGEFGHSATNPIPVNGTIGEIKYLNRLRCECRVGLMFHRLGAASVSGIKGNIDVYETVCLNGKHWDILFLHMYHPRRSTFLPRGYSFVRFHPFFSRTSLAFGTNKQTRNFPFELSGPIARHIRGRLGRKIAMKYEEFISDKSKFKKTPSQQKKVEKVMSCLTNTLIWGSAFKHEKDLATSRELGGLLYDFCERSSKSFLDELDNPKFAEFHKKIGRIEQEDIDTKELLLAHMWLVFHFMQHKRYEEALNMMHGYYMKAMGLEGKEADQELKHLAMRYGEYREAAWNQEKSELTFFELSHAIAPNIYPKEKADILILFHLLISIHFQQRAIALGKILKSIAIKD